MDILAVIGHYLFKMGAFGLVGVLIVMALWPFRRRKLAERREETNRAHELGMFLFAAYLSGLLLLAIQPAAHPTPGLHYNLIPFRIFLDVGEELRTGSAMGLWISFLGNIVIFLPMGFFPALLWHGGSVRHSAEAGFLCSLTIELCQLPIGRSSDVDDLIFNTAGAALGYGLYRGLCKGWSRWSNCCKVKRQTEEEGSSWT